MACVASAVLPRVEVTGEAAQLGTWRHLFFANLRHGLDEALLSVPEEYRAACEAIDVSSFAGLESFESELALVYDVSKHQTRRIPAGKSHRDYGALGPNEIGMTLDVAGVGTSEVLVADFKTGNGWVPAASRNWQLAVGALAMSALNGESNARVALIMAPEGMTPWWDVAVLDGFALAEARMRLMDLAERISTARPDAPSMVLGEQCRYCPSKLHCPAHTGLIQRVAAEPGKELATLTDALTSDKARKAYETLKVLRQVVRDVEARLAEYAEQHPIQLDGGRVYGPKAGVETTVDAEVVRRVLSTLHGPDVADKAVEFEASKASVERALRVVYEKRKQDGQKTTLKALNEEAMAVIEADGGIKTRETVRIKEW